MEPPSLEASWLHASVGESLYELTPALQGGRGTVLGNTFVLVLGCE